jgi:hypothetical protein
MAEATALEATMRDALTERALAAWLTGVLGWVVVLAGCDSGPEPPATHPVQGKIVFERGGNIHELYDHQGAIEFESVDQPGVHAYGEIQEDGSFTLSTVKDDLGFAGAVPGTHRGRLNLDEEIRHLVAPKFLRFETSGITLTVPSQEEVVVKIWR